MTSYRSAFVAALLVSTAAGAQEPAPVPVPATVPALVPALAAPSLAAPALIASAPAVPGLRPDLVDPRLLPAPGALLPRRDLAFVARVATAEGSVSAVAPVLAGASLAAVAAGPREPLATGPMFSGKDLAFWGVALAGFGVFFALDEQIQDAFPDTSTKDDGGFAYAARRLAPFNEYKAFYGAIGLYGTGLIFGKRNLAEASFHAMQAGLFSKVVMDGTGILAGRARPLTHLNEGRERDRSDWKWMRQEVGYRSWPSRHVTGISAITTAFLLETREHWPQHSKWVSPLMVALPVAAGLGRMYTQHHWSTDVWSGLAFGAYTGWKTVHFNHKHPNSWFERVFLPD